MLYYFRTHMPCVGFMSMLHIDFSGPWSSPHLLQQPTNELPHIRHVTAQQCLQPLLRAPGWQPQQQQAQVGCVAQRLEVGVAVGAGEILFQHLGREEGGKEGETDSSKEYDWFPFSLTVHGRVIDSRQR